MNSTVFLLDNIDSFTYNLVDELRSAGCELQVFRNHIDPDYMLAQMRECPSKPLLLLSPGPGTPTDAGCMMTLLDKVAGEFPVLGICLGHQAIVQHYGGVVDRAPQVMHGKSSLIDHCGENMFAGLPQPLPVARYHSLMATTTPDELDIIARYEDVPMAVYHPEQHMLGYQFHPESILTADGSRLLKQSIAFLTQGEHHG